MGTSDVARAQRMTTIRVRFTWKLDLLARCGKQVYFDFLHTESWMFRCES